MDASPAPAPLPDTAPGAPPDAPPDTPPEPREISLQDFLDEARAAQRAGRLAEAEAMYLHLLQQAPDEPNALNFLGVLRFQQGLHDLALATLMRAIRAAPDDAGPWINLANVLIETDRLDDAVKALGNAAALAPRSVQIVNNLGVLHLRRQDWGLAEQHLRRALELWPERSYLHENLAQVCLATGRAQEAEQHLARALLCMGPRSLSRKLMLIAHDVLGDRAAALRTVQEWLEAEPDNPEARHHLAALGAAVVPPRAPDDYVSQLFDGFAQSFDAQLARLGYRGPTLVVDELRRLREGLPAEATVVDAGCGTGLCGPGLRPLAARLVGVDLSGGMLRHAAAGKGYDELHQAELGAFLAQRRADLDAVVAADVMSYFGELDGVMQALATALRPGGVVVLTFEALDEPAAAGFALRSHGRYAHQAAYVCAAALHHGLVVQRLAREVLRSELGRPIASWVLSATRAPAPAA